MSSFLKRNVRALQKNNPILAQNQIYFIDFLNSISYKEDVKYEDSKLKFRYQDQWYCLYGKEPQQEVIYLTEKIDSYKEYLILLFGIANIELLKWLKKNTNEGAKIAVFEPNQAVLKYCLNNYNLESFIESPKFAFMFGEKKLMDREILLYFSSSWENLIQNLTVISLPNYHMYSEMRNNVIQSVNDRVGQLLKSYGNSLPDMMNGFRNHFKNIDSMIKANDCREIQDKYKGYPAIIVASGPSLDKNIDDLKAAQGKALIIACDASYQVCMEHGIIPDMIASIERDKPTYNAFYKGRKFHDGLVLIGPSLLWPDIHCEFPGKQILFAKNCVGIENWWMKQFSNTVFVDLGHSCATAAFAVARYAGCEPIILVGQDLAFTDNKRHSSRIQELSFKPKNELGEKAKKNNNLWVEDIYGNMVRTTETFNLFRLFFERATLMQITVVDATEGGALIHGSKIMKLKEAIETYCVKTIPFQLNEILKDIEFTDEEMIEKYENFLKATDVMLQQIREVQQRANEHYMRIKKYKDFDYKQASEQDLISMLMDLQEGNEILNFIREERDDIVSFYQQILKYTVIYVKKIGNELTQENVKRNWELQVNLMNMIDIASVAVGNQLIKLKQEIVEKKNNLLELTQAQGQGDHPC